MKLIGNLIGLDRIGYSSAHALQRLPSRQLTGLLLILLLLCGASGIAHAQDSNGVCRVTTAGGYSTGADWNHSMSLSWALNSSACEEVWVAQGAYFPDAYPFAFVIRPNLRVYGGFAGNESSRAQRDPAAHVTILSGDKDHNDINADGNFIAETPEDINGTNSQNVVKFMATPSAPITNTTVLDGFTITAGDALRVNGFGGGLNCFGASAGNECSPTLSRLVFAGSQGGYGGALYLNGSNSGKSSPVLQHIVFTNNYALEQGGGMFCEAQNSGTCNPTLTDVVFSYNQSDNLGGGMFNDGRDKGISSPSLTDVTFDHNSAFYQGGAMMNFAYGGTSSPDLLNVTFSNNSASIGGAMYNMGQIGAGSNGAPGDSSPSLRNVTFSDNEANTNGGAMYNWGAYGGVTNPTFYNVTFSGNSAGTYGGAIFNKAKVNGTTDTALTNVILWGNTADVGGPNIYIDDANATSFALNIKFSIVDNGDSSIAYDSGRPSSAYVTGINYNNNPGLGPLSNNGGLTKTMVPGATSIGVDNGICDGAPPVDQRGVSRPTGAGCDIGAVENLPDTIFVDGFE